MSSWSSYRSVDSQDDTTSWLVSSEDSMEDEDELTLLNGDEENYENSSTFEDFLRLSMRLKKQYNLREASVALERCDKIWDTMQLLKRAQESYARKEELDETDEENDEQEDWAKSSHGRSGSVSSSATTGAISYIKYEPTQGNGNNALPNFYLSVKKQTKIYNCGTCGKIYTEKRAFRIHLNRDHGIAAVPDGAQGPKLLNNSETRPKTPQSTDTSSVDGDRASRSQSFRTRLEAQYPCPICKNLYTYKGSLRTHAKEVHGLDIPTDDKGRPTNKKDAEKSGPRANSNKDRIPLENVKKRGRKTEHTAITYVYTHARINNMKGYLFFCITCHKEFCEKRSLRIHMTRSHKLSIPKGPEGTLSGLFIRDIESSRQYLRRLRPNQDSERSPLPPKTERAGPLSSKTFNRPKRACTMNTSYAEATKEEEEILQYQQIADYANSQPASSRPTPKCFLCQRFCTDMPSHLKDYHRISKPETVLPLNERFSSDPSCKKNNDGAKKMEAEEKREQEESVFPIPARKSTKWASLDKQMDGLYRAISKGGENNQPFQCLMCNSNFANLWNVKVHLAARMKNGVVQMHGRATTGRNARKGSKKKRGKKEKAVEDPPKVDAVSMVDSESNSTKRRTSYSDTSSSMSEVMPFKRRKFELAKASQNITDKSSDSGSGESEEEEENKAIRSSEKNARYDQVDGTATGDNSGTDKSPDQRDTRDSSDRDSGIGISITIKKRNDSYEVVERDNCEGDKVKDEEDREVSKDVISEDSSSDTTTNSNYHNGHDIAAGFRKRELLDSLDRARGPSIEEETRGQDDNDDINIIGVTHRTLSRSTEQMSKQNVRSSHKATTEIPGVPDHVSLCWTARNSENSAASLREKKKIRVIRDPGGENFIR